MLHLSLLSVSKNNLFICCWKQDSHTVAEISVWTNPILCTKSPNFTMLFYYIKMRTSSSPYHPFLQLTGALKWRTVWTSISTGVETTHGQSQSFEIYLIKNELLTLTMRSFYPSWDSSSYSMYLILKFQSIVKKSGKG